jgi:hypothetical protein
VQRRGLHRPDARGAEVHQVFLDPSVSSVQARIAGRAHRIDADKTPERLEENVAWMRGSRSSSSAVVDNSDLDVDETVDAVYAAVQEGSGRMLNPGPGEERCT